MSVTADVADAAAADAPKFVSLFWASAHKANLCTVTMLAWLAACDGTVAAVEEALLRRIHGRAAGASDVDFDEVLAVARAGRLDDMEVACRYVMTHFTKQQKRLLAQLAIMLTAEDGVITVGENYCLQFIADLTGIKPRAMAKLFEQVTRRPFPEAGDPSSVEWWRRREAGMQAEPARDLGPEEPAAGAAQGWQEQQSQPRANDEAEARVITRARALALLGLSEGASADAVRAAFRRLAKVRHPDRFAKLGPSAVAAATESFQQLEGAYEILKA
jgi:uncharacterized tellurite resistance protein B-like protein